jgi:hypothetical protein
MARRLAIWLLALSLAGAAGCRSRSDLVEAELRTKDRQLREAQGELMRAETMNEALENTLREQRAVGVPVCRPGAGPLGLVKDIQLGRGTGGIDEDKVAGDEGIMVVVVPRDIDGSAIKAPGTLRVMALEIMPEGTKVPLSAWDVSANQLRQTWRSGLLSTGYHVTLPWQTLPRTEKLRIVAQFQPLEGGVFEAERDVVIRLLLEPHQRPSVVHPPVPAGPGLPPPAPAPLATPPPPELPVGPPPRTIPPAEPIGPPKPLGAPGLPTSWQKPAVQILLPVPARATVGAGF